jgi:hypothetical protein
MTSRTAVLAVALTTLPVRASGEEAATNQQPPGNYAEASKTLAQVKCGDSREAVKRKMASAGKPDPGSTFAHFESVVWRWEGPRLPSEGFRVAHQWTISADDTRMKRGVYLCQVEVFLRASTVQGIHEICVYEEPGPDAWGERRGTEYRKRSLACGNGPERGR